MTYFLIPDAEMVEVTTPLKRIKIEHHSESTIKQVTHKRLSESELYTKLHLGVLNSLRAGRRPAGPATAISAHLIAALTSRVQAYAHQVVNRGGMLQTDEKLQVLTIVHP